MHLHGDFDLIYNRMMARSEHYMRAVMLRSQFDTLELPQDAIVIEIDQSVEMITKEIFAQLRFQD